MNNHLMPHHDEGTNWRTVNGGGHSRRTCPFKMVILVELHCLHSSCCCSLSGEALATKQMLTLSRQVGFLLSPVVQVHEGVSWTAERTHAGAWAILCMKFWSICVLGDCMCFQPMQDGFNVHE